MTLAYIRLCTLAVAVLAAMNLQRASHGADFAWNQPAGGLFGDAVNWNDGTGGVPGAGDVAIFDIVAPSHTVEMTESRSNDRLIVRRSLFELVLAGPDVVYELLGGTAEMPDLIVGEQPGNIGGFSVRDGVVRVGHVSVARAPTSAGSFGVGGTDTNFVSELDADVLLVGDGGTGSMEISGAFVTVGRVEVGVGSSAYGQIGYGGPSAASFTIESDLVIGGAGLGVVTIAQDFSAGTVLLGRDAGSSGRLRITDGLATVAGDVEVGGDGTGMLDLERGARLDIGGDLIAQAPPESWPIQFVLDSSSPVTAVISVANIALVSGIAIERRPGYVPEIGDEFPLITAAAGLENTTVLPPELPALLASEIVVTDTEVLLRIVDNACRPGPGEDCNRNGVRDACDIADGTSLDCNSNQRPDACDIADGTSVDCNSNGLPDACDIALWVSRDCNDNGVPDECDIADGASADCDANDVPDECDVVADDCNGNGLVDSCEVADGTSADCDANDVPDECDVVTDDCNGNGIVDACEIADGTIADCNFDAIPDECDLADGTSDDCDEDGIPDECTPVGVVSLRDAFGDTRDAFGVAVDVDGDFAVVGSPGAAPPFVTVFVRREERWVRDARLTPSTGAPGDGFGRAVGVGGSTLVVGAPTAAGGGAAYVFEHDESGTWSEVARLDSGGAGSIDGFGASVDTNGVYVIVGARLVSDDEFRGVGYIFAGARSLELDLFFITEPSNASVVPSASVGIGGDIAAILWPGDSAANPGQLAAVVRVDALGTWFARTIVPPDGIVVGPDLAVDDAVIAVRTESDGFRGVAIARFVGGTAYRFDTLFEQPEGDSFGTALAVADGRLVVGAAGDGASGRVYTYGQLTEALWRLDETLEVPAPGVFGAAVGFDGSRAILGATAGEANDADAGTAWIAERPAYDCNANGVSDVCDIQDGTSEDADGDGVPDECQDACPWDLDETGSVGFNDLSIVLVSWGPCPNCLADVNGSGSVGFFELSELLTAWGDCP